MAKNDEALTSFNNIGKTLIGCQPFLVTKLARERERERTLYLNLFDYRKALFRVRTNEKLTPQKLHIL